MRKPRIYPIFCYNISIVFFRASRIFTSGFIDDSSVPFAVFPLTRRENQNFQQLLSSYLKANLFNRPVVEFHNAPVSYPTMHHFVTKRCACVHIYVIECCIVVYLSNTLLDFKMGLFGRYKVLYWAWGVDGLFPRKRYFIKSKISPFCVTDGECLLEYCWPAEVQMHFHPSALPYHVLWGSTIDNNYANVSIVTLASRKQNVFLDILEILEC